MFCGDLMLKIYSPENHIMEFITLKKNLPLIKAISATPEGDNKMAISPPSLTDKTILTRVIRNITLIQQLMAVIVVM